MLPTIIKATTNSHSPFGRKGIFHDLYRISGTYHFCTLQSLSQMQRSTGRKLRRSITLNTSQTRHYAGTTEWVPGAGRREYMHPLRRPRSFSAAACLRKPCHGWTSEGRNDLPVPFSSVFHSTNWRTILRRSRGAAELHIEKVLRQLKRMEWHMRNNGKPPMAIVKPPAVGTVLQYYRRAAYGVPPV